VTGSTRGLGLSLAREFVALGDSVVINGRDAAAVEAARASLEPHCTRKGQRVLGLAADISSAKGCDSLAAAAAAGLGHVDIWVNNAGVTQQPKAPLSETAAEEVQAVVGTNLLGTLFGCRSALRLMREQGYGTIYNMDGSGSRGECTAELTNAGGATHPTAA
jgi:NAD(P)-dependent dehydrogenase (short-subunit alcohol dehydrogenase family)